MLRAFWLSGKSETFINNPPSPTHREIFYQIKKTEGGQEARCKRIPELSHELYSKAFPV